MHKIYLLLRNNQQSGPYNLEELVQSGLKPDDLLWIEGKSVGWFYPSELDDLKSYISPNNIVRKSTTEAIGQPNQDPTPKAAGEKKIFVSLPNKPQAPAAAMQKAPEDTIEQKAEALRKKVQAYSADNKTTFAADIPDNDYSYSFQHSVSDDSTSIYSAKTKTKNIPARSWAIAIVAVMLLAVGIIIWQQAPDNNIKATSGISQKQTIPAEETPVATDSLQSISPDMDYNRPAIDNEKVIHKASYATVHSAVPTPAAQPQQTTNRVAKRSEDKAVKNDIPSTDDPVMNTTGTTASTNEKTTTAAPEKKKSLGKRIDDLFDRLKRKKETESTTEAPTESTTQPGSSERKSVHRDDAPATAPTETIDLASLVDITANEPADSWMMGIRGLKITLRNNSNETIKTAKVEVRYYSEQNELLQKKIISFANIPPKKSATVPAPDHSLADHTDYALVSVSP